MSAISFITVFVLADMLSWDMKHDMNLSIVRTVTMAKEVLVCHN